MAEESGKIVLVTGASGFVGSHTVDAFLESGWRVRCLVRRTSRLDRLPIDQVELRYGGMTDAEALAEAVTGVDAIVHVAGLIAASDEASYLRVNAEGTRVLARAARERAPGLRRFVLVSSVAAAGPSERGRPRREEDPEAPVGPYGKSKLAGERVLQQEAGTMAWTILRPPTVYGPRDDAFRKLFAMVRFGLFLHPAGPEQEVSIIHARDLAEAALLSVERDAAAGRTYFTATDEITTFGAFAALAGETLGKRVIRVPVPRAAVRAIAALSGAWAALRGRANPIPANRLMDLFAPAWTCSGERARRELGWAPRRRIAEAFPETVRWYREAGLL